MDGIKVGLVLGSDSDIEVVKPAVEVLENMGVGYELIIASAHRTPQKAAGYAQEAASRGIEVIIAVAGMAAHLPGVLAAYTNLPVIGLPVASGPLGGLDALLAMAQMPPGVPVATMAVNGARNAAVFAVEVLALKYPEVAESLREFRSRQSAEVEEKAGLLEKLGLKDYLNQGETL